MMHGFIDLVFEHEGKFYVCDYKSSHLGDSFSDYTAAALQLNIENNYYDLQYLIYSLALHRYLTANLTNYDPKEHFGGIYYLYLRGMSSTTEAKNTGVYHRKITKDELTALDQLFMGIDACVSQGAL
jgi:exodeoxyribonuclease V beta subunit